MRGSRFALLAPGAVMALVLPVMVLGCASRYCGRDNQRVQLRSVPERTGGSEPAPGELHVHQSGPASNETVEDYPQAVWHDGAAWHGHRRRHHFRKPDGHVTSAHFNAATDINHTVSGPDTVFGLIPIPADSFIIAVNSPTSVTLNHNATGSKTAVSLTINNSTTRSVTDGVTTNASNTITSATANFLPADVGRIVTGTNIPGYDKIASVTNTTTAVLTTAATATGTAQTLTIGANEQVSSTREVTDASITSGSTTLSSASANFQASDLQLPVTGCGIPAGTYITSVTDASDVVLSQAATVTRPFAVIDGVTTSGSTTVTSATADFSTACDADKCISGTGIPAGAYIKTVTNSTTVTLSAKATATGAGVSLTETPGATEVIGLPSATAPANADAVSPPSGTS